MRAQWSAAACEPRARPTQARLLRPPSPWPHRPAPAPPMGPQAAGHQLDSGLGAELHDDRVDLLVHRLQRTRVSSRRASPGKQEARMPLMNHDREEDHEDMVSGAARPKPQWKGMSG